MAKETITTDHKFYNHELTVRVRFDPEFIRRQIVAWRLECNQGKNTRDFDQLFVQVNNEPQGGPSHAGLIRSDYQTFIDGFYICTLIIMTGLTADSEIFTAIREAKHAYLHNHPGKPYIAECFLED